MGAEDVRGRSAEDGVYQKKFPAADDARGTCSRNMPRKVAAEGHSDQESPKKTIGAEDSRVWLRGRQLRMTPAEDLRKTAAEDDQKEFFLDKTL